MFKPKPVRLLTLMQISTRHFSMAVRIASTCFFFLSMYALVILKLLGATFPSNPIIVFFKVKLFLLKHKLLLFIAYFVLFALPGNLTALWVLMSYQFNDYKIFPVYSEPVLPRRQMQLGNSGLLAYDVKKRQPRILTFFVNLEKGCSELYAWLLTLSKKV
jgi:hypothetical protein